MAQAPVAAAALARTDHLLDDVQRDGLDLGRLVRASELEGTEVAVAVGVLHGAAAATCGRREGRRRCRGPRTLTSRPTRRTQRSTQAAQSHITHGPRTACTSLMASAGRASNNNAGRLWPLRPLRASSAADTFIRRCHGLSLQVSRTGDAVARLPQLRVPSRRLLSEDVQRPQHDALHSSSQCRSESRARVRVVSWGTHEARPRARTAVGLHRAAAELPLRPRRGNVANDPSDRCTGRLNNATCKSNIRYRHR
jgi:hypothetical protein